MRTESLLMCAAGAALSISGVAFAGPTVVAEFAINDHPNGGLLPPSYALRLDEVFGGDPATYSADTFDNATLTVFQDGAGAYSINISGTLFGGPDNGSGWVNPFEIEVSMNYNVNVVQIANGWQVNGFTTMNSGTFTRVDTNQSVTLYGMESMNVGDGPIGSTFVLAEDGYRIDGDNSTWVGRGWLTSNDDGTAIGTPAQDWLFRATVIPSPGALALLGMGGLAAARRRR